MKTNRFLITGVLLLAALLLVAGCGTPAPTSTPEAARPTPTSLPETEEPTSESEVSPTVSPTAMPTETKAPTEEVEEPETALDWAADGVVSDGEYTDEAEFNPVSLWWRHDGEFLYLAMAAETTGWVSIGIEPSLGMKDANFLLGYVAEGETQIWDAFGTAVSGANHPPDTELGGTDDIVAFGGSEEEGRTLIEVQIPLDSGDEYDHPLEPGSTYRVIVALGRSDEFDAYHPRVGSGQLALSN
ncbi:MAG: DOMON domain-containing protein [Anaerolineae bacterium]